MSDVNNSQNGPVSLRPKARLLKTLGEELISSETVALIELVKNAYDADARTVLIEFKGDVKSGSGSVTIYDDGHGMDIGVIRDSWMVIAAPTKQITKLSKSGTRRVLGEKGIGRFATSRIARELELITRVPGGDRESYAFFDWSQFDNNEAFLDEIVFLAEERAPKDIVEGWLISKYQEPECSNGLHGTILRMTSLKHFWEKGDFDQLQRGLSRLVSPFKGVSDFQIYVDIPSNVGEIATKIEPPELIKYPHYTVKGELKDGGRFSYSIVVESTGELHNAEGFYYAKFADGEWEVIPSNLPMSDFGEGELREIQCGPFSFELRIWDRDELDNVNQKIGGGIRSIRKDLDSIAGINIYRDGFRVLPYGEPDNDWLRLDIRRVQKPTRRLSNNQITGYISISADKNPGLHDRSNREGLDNNIAYSDMQDVMMQVLTELEGVRYLARRRIDKAKSEGGEKRGLFEEPNLSALKDSLKIDTLDVSAALKLVSQAEADWKRQIKGFQDVLSQYHSLATLGAIIDKVLHDGRQPLATIQTEAGLGREFMEDLSTRNTDAIEIRAKEFDAIKSGFQKIVDQASILRDVFRRVEPFGGRKRGRPKKYYIEDLIKDVFHNYRMELSDNGIVAELPDGGTLVSVDVTELTEIFTNLLINSIHWLGAVPRNKRFIRVLISRVREGELEILFSDTGPGVDQKYRDHIFDPYFSTRPDGHGLGLCMVGEIVKDYYNGSVELMDSGRKGGAVFRIVLRKRV